MLLRVARTLSGSWADAEDVVQESLIRAWRAADRFDGAHPRAWLLTILRHTFLNFRRRERPDLVADASGLEGHRPAFGAAACLDPEQRHVEREFSAALTTAIVALDPRYRTVLLLIDIDQLSYAQAGAVLHVPLGTAMSRLSRARANLRRRLGTLFPVGRIEPMMMNLRAIATCRCAARQVQRYLDGDLAAPLDAAETQRLEAHLAECARCTGRVEQYRALGHALQDCSAQHAPDPARVARLHEQVERLIAQDHPQ